MSRDTLQARIDRAAKFQAGRAEREELARAYEAEAERRARDHFWTFEDGAYVERYPGKPEFREPGFKSWADLCANEGIHVPQIV